MHRISTFLIPLYSNMHGFILEVLPHKQVIVTRVFSTVTNPTSEVWTPCLCAVSSRPPIFTYTFLGRLPCTLFIIFPVLNWDQFFYSMVPRHRLWQKGSCNPHPQEDHFLFSPEFQLRARKHLALLPQNQAENLLKRHSKKWLLTQYLTQCVFIG